MKDFESCGKCNDGYIINKESVSKCNCRKEYETDLRLYNKMLGSGLINNNSSDIDYDILKNYSLKNYSGKDNNGNIPKLEKFIDNFKDKEKPFRHLHFYVHGEQGCQKSFTFRGICCLLAKQGFNTYFIFAKDLITLISDSERNEESQKKLDYLMGVDFLVIDEWNEKRLGLYTTSQYKETIAIVWVKERLEIARKSTVFLSNSPIAEIKGGKLGDLYGDLIDRETRYAQLYFNDNYGANLDVNEFNKTLESIWG